MSRLLVIGCGGVASVAIRKCCMADSVVTDLMLASRTKKTCDELADKLNKSGTRTRVVTAAVNADDAGEVEKLIRSFRPDVVLNLALPYQDLAVMDACLACGVDYIDTANYECEDTDDPVWRAVYEKRCKEKGFTAYFDYSWQWAYREKFAKAENGKWVEVPAMSIKREYDFPEVGKKDMYLLHHEEIESLAENVPGVRRIRFFMTFGQSYLTHMECLRNVGMLSTTPVMYEGREIVPIQFLKALLPDPATLGPRTHGKTNIGCIFTGKKDGKDRKIYIYNVCDHQACYREVESQAISYTTGVPAMIAALLVATGKWTGKGVYNVEEFDPDPFMDALNAYGLPWVVDEDPVLVD